MLAECPSAVNEPKENVIFLEVRVKRDKVTIQI
jgi:hypothetical protein